jgi:hypothetical protein
MVNNNASSTLAAVIYGVSTRVGVRGHPAKMLVGKPIQVFNSLPLRCNVYMETIYEWHELPFGKIER